MNNDYPPLLLNQPVVAQRRRIKSNPVRLDNETIARRASIVQRLKAQIQPLAQRLSAMTDEQRKAIFVKIEHDLPIPLTGTGLKAISEPSEHFTLAISRSGNLDPLIGKLDDFVESVPKNNVVAHSTLALNLRNIQEGEPKDRLSEVLFDRYDELIIAPQVICEIELLSPTG